MIWNWLCYYNDKLRPTCYLESLIISLGPAVSKKNSNKRKPNIKSIYDKDGLSRTEDVGCVVGQI